jgi:hypothetical protein
LIIQKKRFFAISNSKKTLSILAAILITTGVLALASLPASSAHEPPWTIPTYGYITVNPNPIGVGQPVFVVFWIDLPPPTSTGNAGDRWRNLKVDITKPDGTVQNLGTFTSDPIGGSYALYTPDAVGTYKFDFSWPGQVLSLTGPTGIPGNPSAYVNDTYLPCNATATLTVQQEQIPGPPTYPLPTNYWTRPIEGQNAQWASIGSNWLGGAQLRGWSSLWQKDGVAPNTGHIMWTRPIEFGGIVGGTFTNPDVGFYSGGSYEGRFDDAVIMNGRLYFTLPLGHAAKGGGYICLDLQTGEQIWYREDLGSNDTDAPSKGQLYEYESPNQHGVVGGMLWQTIGSTWNAYDPFTGMWMYTLTNVPGGTEVYTDNGEIVRYVLNYNRRWLALWNNTAEHQGLQGGTGEDTNALQWRPNGKTVNMSQAYSWNVTVPDLPGTTNPAIVSVLPEDLVFGRSSNVGLSNIPRFTDDPYTLWALNLNETRGPVGSLLWIKNYPAPPGNITRMLAAQPIDIVNRVFTMTDYETGQRWGYNLDNGNLSWGPIGTPYQEASARAYQYYSGRQGFPAYGNLYVAGFGGEIFAYSMKDGSLLWKYNNTYSGLETPYGLYPTDIFAIADGKVFAFNTEHSPNYPLYRGESVRVVDAFTGEDVWTMMSWAGTTGGSRQPTSIVADGFVVYYNFYDNQIYCIGKGPTATNVAVSSKMSTLGSNVLIEGSVIDISAGTTQTEQAGNFPNGVPAASDETMSAWMEHVYMQKPMLSNATGVPVHLSAIDPNGNYQEIGNATSDYSGNFAMIWNPPIEGMYTVTAKFEGSQSYWPSNAETHFVVGPTTGPVTSPSVSPTPTAAPSITPTITLPVETVSPSPSPAVVPPGGGIPATTYIAIAVAVIIIVAIAAAIVLRRRK